MFTDSDALRLLLCGNFWYSTFSSLILFKCFLIVWLWDCLALCRNPSDIWWCHLKEYTKGFQGFSSLVEYGNLPNKNVWQLFWGCDGWLPLAIAQKWLRHVPWHVEYYGAQDETWSFRYPLKPWTLWAFSAGAWSRGQVFEIVKLQGFNGRFLMVFFFRVCEITSRATSLALFQAVTRPYGHSLWDFFVLWSGQRSVLLVKSGILPRHHV